MLGSVFVDAFRALIFATAHLLGGSLGAGVLAVSFGLRVALLPLTLRLARRARDQQRILIQLKPELAKIQRRFGKDLLQQQQHTAALYRRSGYRPLDPATMLGNLAQLPILGGVYGALRRLGGPNPFLWVLDLARPDVLLASIAATLSAVAGYLGAQAGATSVRTSVIAACFGAALSLIFLWHASASLVLSWGASSAVNVVQGALLAREGRRRVQPN